MVLKASTIVLVLAICCAVAQAQTTASTSGDVRIAIHEGTPEYCLGPHPLTQLQGSWGGPNDILLRLPLRLRYENHRSETIFLPRGYRFIWRMVVAGQDGSTTLRNSTGGALNLDVQSLMSMPRPEGGPFWIVTGGTDTNVPNFSVLKFPDTVDDTDFVIIPVLDRSVGWDLRGKTVQVTTTRDFQSSIAPDAVQKLNEKWKDYGTVWARPVESDTLTLQIPEQPLVRTCSKGPLPR